MELSNCYGDSCGWLGILSPHQQSKALSLSTVTEGGVRGDISQGGESPFTFTEILKIRVFIIEVEIIMLFHFSPGFLVSQE